MRTALTVVATLLLCGNALAQAKPSFDCAKAKSLAEKGICADPKLAELDAAVARNYASALAILDAGAGKALKSDQYWFVEARDNGMELNKDEPKDKQIFDLADFLKDRAAFLVSIAHSPAGFVGTWSNLSGSVEIKAGARGKLEINAQTTRPITASWVCDVSGSAAPAGQTLAFNDTDEANKPTGWRFAIHRKGDMITVDQNGPSSGDASEPPACGHNGTVAGSYFFSKPKS